jgi:flagellar motor switch protein FliM
MECLLHGISAEVAASGHPKINTFPTAAESPEVAATGRSDACQADGQRDSLAETAKLDDVRVDNFAVENPLDENGLNENALDEQAVGSGGQTPSTGGFDGKQLREFQTIHENFADLLAVTLRDKLRTKVDVRVTKICQPTFGEYVFGLENPTCFLTIDLPPFSGRHCLDIQPTVLFPMIDLLLGGGKHAGPIVRRPLTEIETRLLRRISVILFDQLRNAWRKYAAIKPEIHTIESNPKISRCTPPGAQVYVVEFEVGLPFARGALRIAYPVAAMAAVHEHLSGLHVEPLGAHQHDGEGSSEVRVLIAEKDIDADSDLFQMQVGDIVSTRVPCSEPAKIEIDGQVRYMGRLGQHEGRKAILIVGEADGHDARKFPQGVNRHIRP